VVPSTAQLRCRLQEGHVVEAVPQEFGGDGDPAEAGAHDEDPRCGAVCRTVGRIVFLTIS